MSLSEMLACLLMKRSPLTQRTPLKRGKPLAKVSAKKQSWHDKYHAKTDEDKMIQHCANCGLSGNKNGPWLERHHFRGRHGENIMHYVYICGPGGCGIHRQIHDNGKLAREQGWLWKEYDGLPHDPNQKIPWEKQV